MNTGSVRAVCWKKKWVKNMDKELGNFLEPLEWASELQTE